MTTPSISEEAVEIVAGELWRHGSWRINWTGAQESMPTMVRSYRQWARASLTAALPHLSAALAEELDAEKRNSANLARMLVEVSDENERLRAVVERIAADDDPYEEEIGEDPLHRWMVCRWCHAEKGKPHSRCLWEQARAALAEKEEPTLAEALGADVVRQYGSHAEAVRAEMNRRSHPGRGGGRAIQCDYCGWRPDGRHSPGCRAEAEGQVRSHQ